MPSLRIRTIKLWHIVRCLRLFATQTLWLWYTFVRLVVIAPPALQVAPPVRGCHAGINK